MPNATTVSILDSNSSAKTVSTIDNMISAAGTASSNVLTVQGSSSMTPVKVDLLDGSGNAITSTSNALDINVKSGGNANGLATANNSAPVIPATTTVTAAVTPSISTSAYTAGNVIGGIMTFSGLLDSVRFAGLLESITAKFKGTTVTGSVTLNIFKASPSNGTYTDKSAPSWNAADGANLLGSYTLSNPISNLGTMTIYNLDGIAKAIVGSSQSISVVMTLGSSPTPATPSDLTVELGVLPG